MPLLPGQRRMITAIVLAILAILPSRARGGERPPVAHSTIGARLELGDAPLRVPLQERAPLPGVLTRIASNGQRLLLIVHGLRMTAAPGVTFDIYWDRVPVAVRAVRDRRYLGTLSFFNAAVTAAQTGRDAVFDITDALAALQHDRQLGAAAVTFLPSGVPAPGSHPTIDSVSLIVHR